MRSSSASANASGPRRASSSSVSIMSMNAAVIVRCSGSLRSSRTCARAAIGMQDATMSPLTGPTSGARSRSTSGGAARRKEFSFGGPTRAGSSNAARLGLIPISPASAIASIETVSVATGPATSNSRWTLPAVKKSIVPVLTPIDMRRVTVPPETRRRPTRSMVRCSSHIARQARSGWPGPSKRSNSASPPHLRSPAPQSYASSRSARKTPSSVSRISSAPIFPLRASRSVSAVNPEMSTKASEPSTGR